MRELLQERLRNREEEMEHIPVMLNEVVESLNLKPASVVVDCTLGTGGHSERLLQEVLPGGKLIGIDKDQESLRVAEERLSKFKGEFYLFQDNFTNLGKILKSLNIAMVDAILFDLGISSFQLKNQAGFSFQEDSFLDMRMDKGQKLSAYDIVNYYSQKELSRIIKEFGEERFHQRIAYEIVKKRKEKPIETTQQLVEIIQHALPSSYLRGRLHPATRTFQAIRIEVNRELENLALALPEALNHLLPGGRIAVISFHSLEDRIVKRTFRDFKRKGGLEILTPKPLRPSQLELKINPRARSAKLRVAERKNGKQNLLLRIFML